MIIDQVLRKQKKSKHPITKEKSKQKHSPFTIAKHSFSHRVTLK